jgi:uncharacterized protein
MAQQAFVTPFEKLPASLPLFPLPNAVVMPGCQLPLNIFEPRYLNMVFDAMATERIIGMVQVQPGTAGTPQGQLFRTGTAGRIVSFSETTDGRLLIVLSGICRFDLGEEIPTTRAYRRCLVDWSRFLGDYDERQAMLFPRPRLMELLRAYFEMKKLETDWSAFERVDDTTLCNVLVAVLPLELAEKQALIETVALSDRAQKLASLMEFELAQVSPISLKRH